MTADNRVILSHGSDTTTGLTQKVEAIRQRLIAEGDQPTATVAEQLDLLAGLSTFPLGRFLLEHRGLNAWWTHQIVTHKQHSLTPAAGLAYQVYECLPTFRATQQRFTIFKQQLQSLLGPDQSLASVPCGLMGDLLQLDYRQAHGASLTGIDLDQAALDGAQQLAREHGLADRLRLIQADAWSSGIENEFDVLTSNGLTIYEPDDQRVTALYASFASMLKPGGFLVSSFLTPPPELADTSSWNMQAIDPKAMALQHLLFVRIIQVKWACFRTEEQTRGQLEQAGFKIVRVMPDTANIFPTVIAQKAG